MRHSLSPVLTGSGSSGIISARPPCGVRHPGNGKEDASGGLKSIDQKSIYFMLPSRAGLLSYALTFSGPIVQRLGHQVFILGTRVRFPLGSPFDARAAHTYSWQAIRLVTS